ncbi:MAG: ATP-binding protein, partial [Myxococcales bacterium]|nr:ATP-binding protein [Myxococcales bacterium]
MPRFFNTGGPCRADRHYMLPAGQRLPGVERLIERQHYFVVHAPRQAGKTTALRALADALVAAGRYAAVLVTAEQGAALAGDIGAAEEAILGEWSSAAGDLPPSLRPPAWPTAPTGDRIRAALEAWAEACPRPLVVFIDEIDALRDDVLLSVLRQLRAGHRRRPEHFPWSLALVGLRDVRDYKFAGDERGRLGTASPFNIKVESLTLRDFSRDEVAELYGQHTEETGQRF